MTTPALTTFWLQVLAVLALEAALVAGAVALLRRCHPAAAWGRRCCQAGITAVLVLTASELSGAGRGLAAWTVGAFSRPGRESAPSPAQPSTLSQSQPPRLGAAPVSGPFRIPATATPVTRAFPVTTPASATATIGEASDSYAVLWLWAVWSLGALVGLARAGLALFLTALFRLRRRTAVDAALVARVQVLARALGLRRRVRVLQSARLDSPIAFGLIHPTVGLPLNFSTRFDVRSQDAILAHELAHLAAHDPFWCFLADVAAALLWWHPAVWWMRRQLHVAGELFADEASLVVADGPETLAQCLVELGARLVRQPFPGPLGVVSFRSHLGRRVQRLLHLQPRVWSPPRRRAALFGVFGAMAMVAVAIVCTAWATPRALTTGDNMKSMQLNWKRSLAAFALLAAFHGPDAAATADALNQGAAPSVQASTNLAAAASTNPQTWVVSAQNQVDPGLSGATPAKPADMALHGQKIAATPMLLTPPAARNDSSESKHGAELEAKLKQILLPEVSFDLPLSEVLAWLNSESMKRDPEKIGVNFLINPNSPPSGRIDPATGLPAAVPTENIDMSSIIIKFNLPLHHVTMKNVLDAVVKVADHPIEYSIEDYAVVFSLKP